MAKTCFVVMAIGAQMVGGSMITEEQLRNRYLIIKRALQKALPTLEVIRADEVPHPGDISSDIFRRIMQSDFVVADITFPNANVYYELGLRHACRLGTILIKEKDTSTAPFDIYGHRYIQYENDRRGIVSLSKKISEQIATIERAENTPDNKFLELCKELNHPFPTFSNRLFPASIKTAIDDQLYARHFYKENILYNIKVVSINSNEVTFETEHSYKVINRSKDRQVWSMAYKFNTENSIVEDVKFNNISINLHSKDYYYGRGINITQYLKPSESGEVYFKVIEKFFIFGSELYTTYTPGSNMKIKVLNSFQELDFDYDILYYENVEMKRHNELTELTFDKGVLPYQGLKLNWKKI